MRLEARSINVVRLSGLFEPHDWRQFVGETGQLDPALDTLFTITSPGGNVPTGFFLIRKVEEYLAEQAARGRKTWIVVEKDCSSMCVPFYYAFENRFALNGTRIGLHGVSLGTLGFDATLTKLYLDNLIDRATRRGDKGSLTFIEKASARGEFSSPDLTAHLARDLAAEDDGLIPQKGMAENEAQLLREL